ncbi:MAG: ATP-binding cassette domain-containing protein [Chloroflexaceae bacterium]
MNRRAIILRLLGQIRGMWGFVIFAILARLLNQIAGIAILAMAAWGLGQVILQTDPGQQSFIQSYFMINLVLFGAAKGIFYYLDHYLGSYIALRLIETLRVRLFQRLEPLAPAGLTHMRSGDLVSRAIADIDRLETFYGQTIGAAVVTVMIPLVALFAISLFSGWLALLFLPFLVAVGLVVPWLIDDLSRTASLRLRTAAADMNAYITDSIQGLRDIVAFGGQERRRQEVRARDERMTRIQGRLSDVSGLQDALNDSLVSTSLVSLLIIGMILTNWNQLLLVEIPPILAIAVAAFGPLAGLRNVVGGFNEASASANRLFAIMDQEPLVQETATTPPETPVEPSIQFESVYFNYPTNGQLKLMDDMIQLTPGQPAATNGHSPNGGQPAPTSQQSAATETDQNAAPSERKARKVRRKAQKTRPEARRKWFGLFRWRKPKAAETSAATPPETSEPTVQSPPAPGPGPWVHNNLNFTIPAGQTVALVGPSGAGKTTVINLLLRFWEADAGHVRIGGVDVRDFPLDDLRRRIAVVSQRTYIFNATIKENILIGKPDATDAEIERAAQLANIHDFIASLVDGYDTRVGEMGARLSGGQRQRLAIARALIKDAPILILDEATSSLDATTEREIQMAIQELMQGRTTIIVAHRLSTVVNADEILVIDQGQVAERGKHAELLTQRGVYARLFASQQDDLLYIE